MAIQEADLDDDRPPRGRWWKKLLLAAGASVAGAAIFIALGQAWQLAGGSCTSICNPPIAGTYGALSGVVFAFIYRSDR